MDKIADAKVGFEMVKSWSEKDEGGQADWMSGAACAVLRGRYRCHDLGIYEYYSVLDGRIAASTRYPLHRS